MTDYVDHLLSLAWRAAVSFLATLLALVLFWFVLL